MQSDWSDVVAAVRESEARYWQMNAMLYALCDTLRSNTDEASVYAKTMIIGRTYQTRIEAVTGWGEIITGLGKNKKKLKEKPIDRVCKAILDCKELDGHIDEVRRLGDCSISESTIKPAIKAHSVLCQALKKFSRGNEARSFASKYLHFHARSVPIYDSVAAEVVKLWSRSTEPSQWFDHKSFDRWGDEFKKHPSSRPYARHCHMVALMAQMWQEAKVRLPPTARNLDTYLMVCGSNEDERSVKVL